MLGKIDFTLKIVNGQTLSRDDSDFSYALEIGETLKKFRASCSDIPPATLRLGEAIQLNHARSGMRTTVRKQTRL